MPIPPPGRELLAGKRVVVTAAAGTGIGSAVAERCLLEGAQVLISDIHERRLGETADRLAEATGVRPHTAICNVTVEDDVQALVAAAVEAMGGIDVMMNNAGLGGQVKLVDMTDEQWSSVLTVTLDGTMRCTRAVMRHMIDAGIEGAIVNNASVVGWRAQAEQCHYAAAKAGVMALTRCAAIEAAEHGININAVAPSIAMHAFLEKVSDPGSSRRSRRRRGVRSGRGTVGGRQRDGVPRKRSRRLYDGRNRVGQLSASLTGTSQPRRQVVNPSVRAVRGAARSIDLGGFR